MFRVLNVGLLLLALTAFGCASNQRDVSQSLGAGFEIQELTVDGFKKAMHTRATDSVQVDFVGFSKARVYAEKRVKDKGQTKVIILWAPIGGFSPHLLEHLRHDHAVPVPGHHSEHHGQDAKKKAPKGQK